MILSELELLSKKNEPRLLIVVGQSGTGKTLLAKALESKISNMKYIDVCELYENNNYRLPNIALRLSNVKKTYLIDEHVRCEQKSFHTALHLHIRNGGAAVLFVQSISGLDIIIKATCFTLSRKSDGCHMTSKAS